MTPEKDDNTSANQTPGGYKFAPLVASQLWQANQHEPASFGLIFLPKRFDNIPPDWGVDVPKGLALDAFYFF